MAQGLDDAAVVKQLNNMVSFIRKEAEEKAAEIIVLAEEEFTIEKAKLVQTQKLKLMKEYERKEKQVDVTKKMFDPLTRLANLVSPTICVFFLPCFSACVTCLTPLALRSQYLFKRIEPCSIGKASRSAKGSLASSFRHRRPVAHDRIRVWLQRFPREAYCAGMLIYINFLQLFHSF